MTSPCRLKCCLVTAVVAFVAMLIVSCGGAEVDSGASELADAIDRMRGLQSVRMVTFGSGPDTTNDVLTVDYQAPDRFHTVQTGTERDESFRIGSTLYSEEPGRPGYYRRTELPPDSPTDMFALLGAMGDQRAVKNGSTYRVSLAGGGSLLAVVKDRYVTELTSEADGVRRVQQFSLFNAAPAVIAPTEDRVVPPLPEPLRCPNGRPPPSTFLCLD